MTSQKLHLYVIDHGMDNFVMGKADVIASFFFTMGAVIKQPHTNTFSELIIKSHRSQKFITPEPSDRLGRGDG